ncbi:MAG: hypothetical protein QNJ90_09175 [Planctomycetota bacterium]|nr:hypothetical protein [Planctomycetota bacterium]
MSSTATAGEVIWARQFDKAASKQRWRKFRRWFLLPLIVVLAIAFAAGGVGAFLGVLILAGALVGMVAVMYLLRDVTLRQNPEIRLADGQLVAGQKSVKVADIERWTTHRYTKVERTNLGRPETLVGFRVASYEDGKRGTRADGTPAFEIQAFTWAQMPVEELETVREALEPHIPAMWVPFEGLQAP